MARVHAQFMQDPDVTDVITFHHGEILVCPEMAERQRAQSGLSLHDEVLTYCLHGLLHLRGQEDQTPAQFRTMARRQDQLRRRVAHIQ